MQNPQIKSPQEGRIAALGKASGRSYPEISRKRSRSKVSPRKEFIEQNRLRLNYERKFRDQLQTLFTRTGQDAAKQYNQSGTLGRTSQDFSGKLADLLTSHYRAVIDAFGLRILRDRKQDSQFETIIRQYVRDVGGIRITQISNSTMQQINRVVENGLKEGLGVASIGKSIRETMDSPFTRYRANTIARTETHSAASYGNHQINASFNIPNQVKRWVSVADARSRATHVAANGQEVPLDEDFIVGGVAMGYTGDPKGGAKNVINCRCVTLYIDPEEEVIQDEVAPEPVRRVVPQSPPEQARPSQRLNISTVILGRISAKAKKEYEDKINDKLSPLALNAALAVRLPKEITRGPKGWYQRVGERIKSPLTGVTLEHEYGHHVDYVSRKASPLRSLEETRNYRSMTDREFQQAFIDDAKALGLAEQKIMNQLEGVDILGYATVSGVNEKLKELFPLILENKQLTKTYTRGRRKGMSFSYERPEPIFEGASSISDIIDAMSRGQFYNNHHAWGHGIGYYGTRIGSGYYETFANLFAIHGNKKAMAEARKLFPNTVREFERMLKEIADEGT